MFKFKLMATSAAVAVCLSTLASCQFPGQKIETVRPEGPLANFRAESTGKRGVPVQVTAYVIVPDGCDDAAWATATVDEPSKTVTVRAASKDVQIVGAGCTAAVNYPSMTTSFTPQGTGTYTIKAQLAPDLSAESQTGGYLHLQPKIELTYKSPRTVIEATQAIEITE